MESAILRETAVIYNGFLHVVKKTYDIVYKDGSNATQTREIVLSKGPTVSALVLHAESKTVYLVKQFRAAVGGWITSLPAGYVDDGETPLQALRREVYEETGVQIAAIELIASFHSSPGWTNEFNHIYLCLISEKPDVSKIQGLASEGEHIELVPVHADSFVCYNIYDCAKTVIAAQWLAMNQRRLLAE
jgi:nudix-type nucleoside diphosphatase (YffH/AdpP family)